MKNKELHEITQAEAKLPGVKPNCLEHNIEKLNNYRNT